MVVKSDNVKMSEIDGKFGKRIQTFLQNPNKLSTGIIFLVIIPFQCCF